MGRVSERLRRLEGRLRDRAPTPEEIQEIWRRKAESAKATFRDEIVDEGGGLTKRSNLLGKAYLMLASSLVSTYNPFVGRVVEGDGELMARATTCMLNGREIDIDEALRLRDQAGNSRALAHDFRCVACAMPVRPHKAGSHMEAHFEHHRRNPECRLSDPRW